MEKERRGRLNVVIYSVGLLVIGFSLSIMIPIINGIDVGNFIFLGIIGLTFGTFVWSFRTMDKKDKQRGKDYISSRNYYVVIIIATITLLIISILLTNFSLLPNTPSSTQVEQKDIITPVGIIILLIVILVYDRYFKKNRRGKGGIRRGWTEQEKEDVRDRQGGMCNKCGRAPPRWEYHHKDGNRSNNSLSNCEGLCPNCHSVKTHG